MDDIEKRARELLAQSSGWNVDDMVEHIGSDVCLFTAEEALEAVRAALAPPELAAAARASLPFIAYAFAQGVDGAEQAGRAIEAALAARPEVP